MSLELQSAILLLLFLRKRRCEWDALINEFTHLGSEFTDGIKAMHLDILAFRAIEGCYDLAKLGTISVGLLIAIHERANKGCRSYPCTRGDGPLQADKMRQLC